MLKFDHFWSSLNQLFTKMPHQNVWEISLRSGRSFEKLWKMKIGKMVALRLVYYVEIAAFLRHICLIYFLWAFLQAQAFKHYADDPKGLSAADQFSLKVRVPYSTYNSNEP